MFKPIDKNNLPDHLKRYYLNFPKTIETILQKKIGNVLLIIVKFTDNTRDYWDKSPSNQWGLSGSPATKKKFNLSGKIKLPTIINTYYAAHLVDRTIVEIDEYTNNNVKTLEIDFDKGPSDTWILRSNRWIKEKGTTAVTKKARVMSISYHKNKDDTDSWDHSVKNQKWITTFYSNGTHVTIENPKRKNLLF